jgi:serine/threonine protein kinase
VKKLLPSEIALDIFKAEKMVFEKLGNIVDENAALLQPIFVPVDSFFPNKHFFILPLAKKDLRQMLKDTASVEVMESLQKQMLPLVEGLAALHGIDIAHRDLDSRNVLVFDDPAGGVILKIADFGHAISLDALNKRFEQPIGMRNFRSNGTYSAPECMKVYTGAYSRHDITAIDVWALGCLLLELAVFIREGPAGVSRLQVLREGPTSAGGWIMQSDLFHDGTSLKPQIRALVEETSILGVFNHSYLQKGPPADVNQTLLRMFNTDPRERPSAREVAMAWKDTEYFPISKVTRQLAGRISASSHIDRLFSWAGKLISKEPPLAPGRKRMYWKCVCILLASFLSIM